ncbi:MAG: NAD(P)H-binding protein [Chloroflexi bacterium]|nr:NAD(P)H-binding protein [Chloroflexota bacterium]MCY4247139.1 NAD(P)H-binding protein [Chloroflexota bacterium]
MPGSADIARGARGILVTGGGSFLGDYIAVALLAEGAPVSLLAQPGAEDKLGQLARHTRWSPADVWKPGSLRGKARGHAAVIHTIGSLTDDPARGASFERLNLVSTRNVANMCISDGVERLIFISGSRAPWLKRGYIPSKRAAEAYLRRSGLRTTIVRAPLLYARDQDRALFFRLLTRLGRLPPLAQLGLGNAAPLAVDLLARGVAQLALADSYDNAIVYAGELQELARRATAPIAEASPGFASRELGDAPDEDLPFGWTPGNEQP